MQLVGGGVGPVEGVTFMLQFQPQIQNWSTPN